MSSPPQPFIPASKVTISPKVHHYLDLNTDLGQSRDWPFFDSDEGKALLAMVSSVNIPCGVHDGHPLDILRAIELAKSHHCVVGAHIAFPDALHQGYDDTFKMDGATLRAWLLVQLGTFRAMLNVYGMEVEHVRPHGALYLRLQDDIDTARVVAKTIYELNPWAILVGPVGPVLSQVSEETGLRIAPEVPLGKHFLADGKLNPQRIKEMMPPSACVEQARQVIRERRLTSQNGKSIDMAQVKTLHLSPSLPTVNWVGQQVVGLLGQPIPLAIALVGKTGWVETFDDRRMEPVRYFDEYE
jgi:5-oxoprolinase (ATP-hydrolysing) subunit A